jgi:hypothetical protein
MKPVIKILLLLIGCFVLRSASCIKPYEDPTDNNGGGGAVGKTVQYYVDQTKYNQGGSGRVIASITINGIDYAPKSFIDNCTERYLPGTTASLNGNPYFRYKINMKNYKSLDALMNGWPFSWEYWEGIIYFSDLKDGCNTLEVIEVSNLFRLAIK